MPFDTLFGATAISNSGMAAERFRMEVIANNLANANSTRSANGGPFRRQDVVFAEALGSALHPGGQPVLRGVNVVGVVDDQSPLNKMYDPGHPDADAEGFVTMPNVQLPIEMVNLITASRAFEANLKAAQTFRTMNEQALGLLRA
jgi:flagellar basal-body rod protein FlgC